MHQRFIFTPLCLQSYQSGWLSSGSQLAAFGINQNNFSNCPASAGFFFAQSSGLAYNCSGYCQSGEDWAAQRPGESGNCSGYRASGRFGVRDYRGLLHIQNIPSKKPEQLFVISCSGPGPAPGFFQKKRCFSAKKRTIALVLYAMNAYI